MNLADFIVLGIIAAAAGACVFVIIRNKHRGKGCGCGCENCSIKCEKNRR